MAAQKKKAPKKIAATKPQLADGVVIPTGRKVTLTMTKRKFVLSA